MKKLPYINLLLHVFGYSMVFAVSFGAEILTPSAKKFFCMPFNTVIEYVSPLGLERGGSPAQQRKK